MMRPTQAKHKAVKATAVATEVDLDMGDDREDQPSPESKHSTTRRLGNEDLINATGPLAPRRDSHLVAQQDLSPHRPGTPCHRSSQSAARLPRPVHATHWLHPPCSCVLARALHRAAFGDPFEYGHHPGGYIYVLIELHTHDAAILSDSACRGRSLSERASAPSQL